MFELLRNMELSLVWVVQKQNAECRIKMGSHRQRLCASLAQEPLILVQFYLVVCQEHYLVLLMDLVVVLVLELLHNIEFGLV